MINEAHLIEIRKKFERKIPVDRKSTLLEVTLDEI